MDWLSLIIILVYFAVGWVLSDSITDSEDEAKMLIFVAWPLIVGLLFIIAATAFILGIISIIINLIIKVCDLWDHTK